MKVVINTSIGGYQLSGKVVNLYVKKKGMKITKTKDRWGTHYHLENGDYFFPTNDIKRNDPILIEVIEELGVSANRKGTSLKIIKIPDDVEFWEIKYHDGGEESVNDLANTHRSWR